MAPSRRFRSLNTLSLPRVRVIAADHLALELSSGYRSGRRKGQCTGGSELVTPLLADRIATFGGQDWARNGHGTVVNGGHQRTMVAKPYSL